MSKTRVFIRSPFTLLRDAPRVAKRNEGKKEGDAGWIDLKTTFATGSQLVDDEDLKDSYVQAHVAEGGEFEEENPVITLAGGSLKVLLQRAEGAGIEPGDDESPADLARRVLAAEAAKVASAADINDSAQQAAKASGTARASTPKK